MAEEKSKANFEPPASQVDLEERLARENRSTRILTTSDQYEAEEGDEGRSFAVEDNDLSGYVGTDVIYQTYANETEKPFAAEEGPEAQVEEEFYAATHPEEGAPADEALEAAGEEEGTSSSSSSDKPGQTSSAPATKPSAKQSS